MQEEKLKLIEVLMIFATITGPVFAVFLTIWNENKRSKRERMIWIFRTLAQDRFLGVSDNFVAAVNLVEIEFYGKEKVINAWNKLRDAHHVGSQENITRRNTELLIEIGKVLKYKDLNFTDQGYFPKLHIENFSRTLDRDNLLINLLKGDSVLNIKSSIGDSVSNNLNINKK